MYFTDRLYFTDRRIEELEERRADGQVSVAWLTESRLRVGRPILRAIATRITR